MLQNSDAKGFAAVAVHNNLLIQYPYLCNHHWATHALLYIYTHLSLPAGQSYSAISTGGNSTSSQPSALLWQVLILVNFFIHVCVVNILVIHLAHYLSNLSLNSRASKVFTSHQQAKQSGCLECFTQVRNTIVAPAWALRQPLLLFF
jgi:hypothetical protein